LDEHNAPDADSWWPRLARRVVNTRSDLLLATIDVSTAAIAFAVVLVLRFDGSVPSETWRSFGWWLPLALLVVLATTWSFGLYGQVWRHASAQEAQRLLGATASILLILAGIHLMTHSRVPWSVILLGTGLAAFLMGATRFQSRLFSFRRNDQRPDGSRVIVVGAKDAGAALVAEMQKSPEAGLVPVAIIDPEPSLQRRGLLGLRVAGGIENLPAVAEATRADEAILAMSSPTSETVRRVAEAAEEAGIALRIVGGLAGRLKSGSGIRSIRDLRIDDLIGRAQVETDLATVRAMLSGRRVLVTGAGGSIGAEIVRQVAACDPAVVVAVDHDESHLHDMAATVERPVVQVLADVRNRELVDRIFTQHRPEIVFHAAAHKHVPLLEDHPCEAVLTNVLGTENLLAAGEVVGIERFVFISTDKAVQPRSVMGASKRVAELLVLSNTLPAATHTAVRFGNVLGSRGSVVPTFVRQIEQGGPVTVTDERMTRYFMSIPEAVQLVLQAAALADGGDLFVLDMGEPVRILELAERMIRLSGLRVGADIEVRVTGMRPGEKLEEELLADDEPALPTVHPAISRIRPSLPHAEDLAVTTARLGHLARSMRDHDVRNVLFEAAQPLTGLARRDHDLVAPSVTPSSP
jgi:FlaA1/EpsC-like NDP-sugar epimerase